jgi:transcription elongation factor Elf1
VAKGGISCGVCGHKQPATVDGWAVPHINKKTGAPCGSEADRYAAESQPAGGPPRQTPARKKRSAKLVVPKKRPKTKTFQDYCPKCNAFVIITKVSGSLTVAEHNTKRNTRCVMSGKPFTPLMPEKRDAMEYRVSGSFGTGKRR